MIYNEIRRFVLLMPFALLVACEGQPHSPTSLESLDAFHADLRSTLSRKPTGSAPAYAIVKDGLAGPDWLATVHGYADNRGVCEELIKPYNSGQETSVLLGSYYCEEIALTGSETR